MADPHLVLLDPDPSFQDFLRSTLTPFGVALTVVDDASDGLGRIRDLDPALVLIAVETSNKQAYGTYSKVRKILPKEVPIAIVTSSVSPEDFEKHRKLQTRADEYVDKRTVTQEELVDVIGKLVPLSPQQETTGDEDGDEADEFDLDVEEAEELAIEEDLPAIEEMTMDPGFEDTNVNRTVVGEGILDAETEAAFAALGLGEGEREGGGFEETVPTVTARPGLPVPGLPRPVEPAPEHCVGLVQAPDSVAAELDLGLDVVAAQAGAEPAKDPRAIRTAELEVEVERLRKELQGARTAAGSQIPAPGSREREFKDLRERINRKERELDELKEELEAKDKLIAAGKDKLKDLDRKMRETEDHLLDLEQELVTKGEQLVHLGHEKDQGLDREKGLKARLDLAQSETRKAQDEIETLKKKLVAEAQSAASSLAAERKSHEETQKAAADRVSALEAEHAASGEALAARLEDEKNQALAALAQEGTRRIEALEAAHADALKCADEEKSHALQALEARLLADQEQALTAVGTEAQRRIEALEAANADASKTLEARLLVEKEHALAALGASLQKEHEAALGAMGQEQQEALVHALDAAEQRRVADLEALARRHAEEAEAASRELSAQFEAERQETNQRHAEALSARDQDLSSAQERSRQLEADLAAQAATLTDRERTIEGLGIALADHGSQITALNGDLEQLSARNHELEQQVHKAHDRIKLHEATVAKAKKALAIALTLLDSH